MINIFNILLKKQLLIISILFLISGFALSNNVNSILDSAKANYLNGKYTEAIDNYEKIIALNYESPELYYNLANSYFKNNKLPQAILNYERAKLLNPQDEYINTNLEIARTYVEDNIEEIPEFFLKSWINSIKYAFSSNNWAIISVSGFILLLIFLLFYLFSTTIIIKKLSFWLGIILFIISIFSFILAFQQKNIIRKHNVAIIFEPTVTIKSSPDESGTDLFLLHEGTKVSLLDSVGTWIEIKIADGNVGWLKAENLEKF